MTDPAEIAAEIVSAANVTTCGGYYEVDIDAAAAAVIERAIASAAEQERVRIAEWLRGQAANPADMWQEAAAVVFKLSADAIEAGAHRENPDD